LTTGEAVHKTHGTERLRYLSHIVIAQRDTHTHIHAHYTHARMHTIVKIKHTYTYIKILSAHVSFKQTVLK